MSEATKRKGNGMRQLTLDDLMTSEREMAAREGRERLHEFMNHNVTQLMPTLNNVKRRLGPSGLSQYRVLRERAEDMGIEYDVDTEEKMNGACVRARLKLLEDAIENLSLIHI